MEDSIVTATQELANTNACFIAGDGCNDERLARAFQVFCRCQGGREHYSGRVENGAVMKVILLNQVRGRAVHQGCEIGTGFLAVDEDPG
ncbi:hypothetical protein D3C81_1917260 [compost metagenome]